MRYLITTCNTDKPFLTNWYNAENNFNAKVGMIVYDLYLNQYTIDGINWIDIEVDHL